MRMEHCMTIHTPVTRRITPQYIQVSALAAQQLESITATAVIRKIQVLTILHIAFAATAQRKATVFHQVAPATDASVAIIPHSLKQTH